MPRRKPRTIVGTASARVPPPKAPMPKRPWKIRNRQLSAMTEKSSVIAGRSLHRRCQRRSARIVRLGWSMLRSPAPHDESRDRHPALDATQDGRDPEAEHQVDEGACGDRLEALRRVALD